MQDDLSALENMVYSGRAILVGKSPSGNSFMGYSVTGRSPSSQARELVEGKDSRTIVTRIIKEDESLRKMFNIQNDTELAQLKSELEKGSPALLVYPAITCVDVLPRPVNSLPKRVLIASNGAQTKLLYSTIIKGGFGLVDEEADIEDGIRCALFKPFYEYDEKEDRWIDITTYEPDAPNNTPRICAALFENNSCLCIVKKGDNEMKRVESYRTYLTPGKGHLISTYKGANEKPLLPFDSSKPLELMIESETPQEIAQSMYKAIEHGIHPNDNYAVAVAVMTLDTVKAIHTYIINRNQRR